MYVTVVSKQPPGGRCTLYQAYAAVLAELLGAHPGCSPSPLKA